MKYFKTIIRRNAGWFLVFMLTGIICQFLGAFEASFLQTVLDAFGAGELTTRLIIIYIAVLGIHIIIEYFDNLPYVTLENRIYLGFKQMALEKMGSVCFRSYQLIGAGELLGRIESGSQAGRGMLYSFWLKLVSELLPGLIFSLIFIDRIDRQIMVYIAAGYVAVFIISNVLLKYLYKVKARILDNEEALNSYLVRGLMEMVLFRTSRRYRSEFKRAQQAAREVTGAKVMMTMIHEAFFTLFALLVIIIKLAVLIASVRGGTTTVGELVALLVLIDRAYIPIAIFNVLYVQYRLDASAFGRLSSFLDLPDDARLSGGEALMNPAGDIVLSRATVEYDGRRVLDGLDLTIPSGRRLALVGESGSGKSTIAKLVGGLILPDSGEVTIGGQNYAQLALDDYFQHLCYMPQEAPLFHGTLRDNLTVSGSYQDAELIKALKYAELTDLLIGVGRLDALVGERGQTLSGGERQRLQMARLFLSDADIVILDEATSALDNETEQLVMRRVLEHMEGRTLIIIAHRLSTVMGVDEIIAMRDGRIVERGSYGELKRAGGYFARLLQAAEMDDQ